MSPDRIVQLGYDALPGGVIMVRDGGGIIYANAAMLALLGCDREWLIGRPISDVMTRPAGMLYHSSVYMQARAHGQVQEIYLDFKDKSGAQVPALCNASLLLNDAVATIVICASRMTERRRMEEDLLRTRRITEQIPGVVYQYLLRADGTHAIPYSSEAMRSMFGIGPSEVQRDASLILTAIHPEDIEAFSASIVDSANELRSWRHQFRARRSPQDPYRWIEGHAVPERLSDGATLWHGFVQDVSDRKVVEDALREKLLADQANRAKSEFLARVSHELRTPLNAILGFAQILARDRKKPLEAVQRARVNHIEDAGRNLLNLIDEVLDITRIESGTVSMEPGWVNVEGLLARTIRLIEEPARQRGVQVSVEVDDDVHVYVDPGRLGQVFTNLLSNAVKYTVQGGQVTATCRMEGEQASISVHDNGSGMTPAQLEHLFEPFNRLGAERTTIQGTGLGLVIVKNLVEAMNGSIAVESSQRCGTTFTVTLPHARRREGFSVSRALGASPAEPKPVASEARVLYVEDNPVNAMVMETILQMREGLTMHVETSGRAAIEWLRNNVCDVILLDMNLPDFTGTELLGEIKSELADRHIEAIAVSADAMPEVIERARLAGFSQYWTKPLDVDETLARLDESLTASRIGASRRGDTGMASIHARFGDTSDLSRQAD